MRKEEAKKVIKIILGADGGCKYCVSSLLKLFIDEFPEYENIAKLAFVKTFDTHLEDFLNQKHKRLNRGEHGR